VKLEGAIILLDQLRTSETMEKLDPLFQEAIQLGIEALERVKAQRGPGGEIGALGLPGETKD